MLEDLAHKEETPRSVLAQLLQVLLPKCVVPSTYLHILGSSQGQQQQLLGWRGFPLTCFTNDWKECLISLALEFSLGSLWHFAGGIITTIDITSFVLFIYKYTYTDILQMCVFYLSIRTICFTTAFFQSFLMSFLNPPSLLDCLSSPLIKIFSHFFLFPIHRIHVHYPSPLSQTTNLQDYLDFPGSRDFSRFHISKD